LRPGVDDQTNRQKRKSHATPGAHRILPGTRCLLSTQRF
jgi:hypothetical protein